MCIVTAEIKIYLYTIPHIKEPKNSSYFFLGMASLTNFVNIEIVSFHLSIQHSCFIFLYSYVYNPPILYDICTS